MVNQNWNFAERRYKFTNHVNLFIETLDPEDRGALFAQFGLHTRGSSITAQRLNTPGFEQLGYTFKNLSLMLGAKRKLLPREKYAPYYFLGVRVEYNLSDNLTDLGERFCTGPIQLSTACPTSQYVNNFTYGISMGGGFEFDATEFFIPAVELTVSPDISYQYYSPEIATTPVTRETSVRNMSIELSLVLKFLREVIYED